MELKKEELIKRRGYIATLEAGYRFCVDNFKTIFKHLWPYALAFAVVIGIFEIINLRTSMTGSADVADVATIMILWPFVFVVAILLAARMMMLFNDQLFKWNIIRAIKLTLWVLLIATVVAIIPGLIMGMKAATAGAEADPGFALMRAGLLAMIILFLLVIVVIFPYIYPIMKYIVEPQTHFRNLIFKGWKKGFKHWGYLFITLLLLYLCIIVVNIIISIPLSICTFAQYISAAGEAQGDVSGTPAYFNILFFVVAVLTFFAYCFVNVFSNAVGYYIYGNIEAYEREKEQQQLPIEPETDETTEDTVY